METQQSESHIGRKVWYGFAIFLSAVILLLSVAGVIGTWAVQRPLSSVTVTLFAAVEDAAGGLRQVAGRIDEGAGEVQAISSEVADISSQISQNVENRGLIALLLPEEREQQLASTIQSVDETLSSIADVVTAGLDLYNTVDRMPFVSLPRPNQARMEEMQQNIAETREQVASMRQSIQVFRTGVADEISKVTQAADQVTGAMDELSSDLSALDADLAGVQEFADKMQVTVPILFATGAVLVTLLLVYGAYTQVEMIRLYALRWRSLGAAAEAPELEAEAVEAEAEEPTVVDINENTPSEQVGGGEPEAQDTQGEDSDG